MRRAPQGLSLGALHRRIVACRLCPRLVAHRERVAREKVRRFQDCDYWGRPLPGFGDPRARLWVIGLAPAAHGGNRTGRIFTGDRSGDWLYAALYRTGFANQPTSRSRDDGLELSDAYVSAVVRCAPPGNKPTVAERDRCLPYLESELKILDRVRVFVPLGGFAFANLMRVLRTAGERARGIPRFGHGALVELETGRSVIGCYHPSQQNTFTGRLTEAMLDEVFEAVKRMLASDRLRATGKKP
ncbi:MAG TPA: uracil-DNA glycosylase [Candidatus Binatia bacterium]|nr:uracil-DNA glycosylase [Candidatus Binatia bacterium]